MKEYFWGDGVSLHLGRATPMARVVAIKKTLENMDRDSLRLLLNASYGMTPAYDAILAMMVLQELQRRKKEEKKMDKKPKIHGHVIHKLPKCENLYYTVEPENDRVAVYMLKYDEGTGEPHYYECGGMRIHTEQLGRHGYLQEQINWLIWMVKHSRHYTNT